MFQIKQEREHLKKYLEETYDDLESNKFEFWEVNKDVLFIIKSKIRRMEESIESEFVVRLPDI